MFYIDGHCDSLSKSLDMGKTLDDESLQFNFEQARRIGGGIQIMAAFINPKYVDDSNGGFNRCKDIIQNLKNYENEKNINMEISSKKELENIVNNSDIKVILSVENGSAISGNLDNVDFLHNLGVKIMSITWNDDNDLRLWC